MAPRITLLGSVRPDGRARPEPYELGDPASYPLPTGPIRSRVAYAAAHVVADPRGANTPGSPAVIDWEYTLAFRHELWSYGLGVAEAMDTAQRGMGLDWAACQELIARSAAEARSVDGRIAAGAGTDQLGPGAHDLDEIERAYAEQVDVVQRAGARVIVMASRQLAASASHADDYRRVYATVLKDAEPGVILHWLGEMFDPALGGYWGGAGTADVAAQTDAFLSLLHEFADRIDGVKVSLLDDAHERSLRERMPDGVRVYTGDDFHYPELIRGSADVVAVDNQTDPRPSRTHSDALLGVFAAIAPAASAALQALDRGDADGFSSILDPTVPLSRTLFEAPTSAYKTGIAFLAWLNGFQPGFTMVGGLQAARGLPHLCEVFRGADRCGLLRDPELAAARMRSLVAVHGLDA